MLLPKIAEHLRIKSEKQAKKKQLKESNAPNSPRPTEPHLTGELVSTSSNSKESKESLKDDDQEEKQNEEKPEEKDHKEADNVNHTESEEEDEGDVFGTIVVTENDHKEDFIQQIRDLTLRPTARPWEQQETKESTEPSESNRDSTKLKQEELVLLKQEIVSEMNNSLQQQLEKLKADLERLLRQ